MLARRKDFKCENFEETIEFQNSIQIRITPANDAAVSYSGRSEQEDDNTVSFKNLALVSNRIIKF